MNFYELEISKILYINFLGPILVRVIIKNRNKKALHSLLIFFYHVVYIVLRSSTPAILIMHYNICCNNFCPKKIEKKSTFCCMFDFKIHAKKGKNAKKGQICTKKCKKCMFHLEIHTKKKSKMKKRYLNLKIHAKKNRQKCKKRQTKIFKFEKYIWEEKFQK